MKKLLLLILIFISLFANCENKMFSYSNSLNINERMPIKEFLNLLLTQNCNINIVYEDLKSKEYVTKKMPFVRIKNYTLQEILDLILGKELFYTLKGNVLEISYYKTKNYKLDFISSNREGESNLDATNSKVKNEYTFDFWDKVEKNIENILKNISNEYKPPIIDKTVGVITVTGTKKQINAVDKYIKTLMDRLTKQVLIDVKIYSVELSKSHQTGIKWSELSLSLPTKEIIRKPDNNYKQVEIKPYNLHEYIGGSYSIFSGATFNIAGFLNFLAQNGNVNAISNPKIVTLNNQKAIISVGDTIYYKYASSVTTDQSGNPITQYTIENKFVGIELDITPQISDNGEIILSINPRISDFKNLNQLNKLNNLDRDRGMPPDTEDNTIFSVVKLKDNDTLVLGGLIRNKKSLHVDGVPILKEIPLIKYIFSSKEKITNKKELVFVITPHIIDFKNKKTLKDLGFGEF